jgi:NAD(P)-dependent dehydrogenase (short-subunit alcohol dehydrogenase family)
MIACRNVERGEDAVSRLAQAVTNANFTIKQLCLEDLSSVRDFCKNIQDQGVAVDVLLNNAGVMACDEMKTKDGFEYQLGVNHLGHFVLTAGLLPLMVEQSRHVSSHTHRAAMHSHCIDVSCHAPPLTYFAQYVVLKHIRFPAFPACVMVALVMGRSDALESSNYLPRSLQPYTAEFCVQVLADRECLIISTVLRRHQFRRPKSN